MTCYFFVSFFRRFILSLSIIFLSLSIYFQLNFVNHNWIYPPIIETYKEIPLEEFFNKNLTYLNSLNKLEEYFLTTIITEKFNDIESVIFADQLLRERFVHRNKNILLKDNWFLYVFNFFSKNRNNSLYLSSVSPDYILRSDEAICNQQALVFQFLMKAIGVEYQSVLLNIPRYPDAFGHFASAVNVNDQWLYIDTDLEPDYDIKDPAVLDGLLNGDKKMFNNLYPAYIVDNIPDGSVKLAFKNKNPAFWGRLFQDICYFISHFAWIVLLAIFFVLRKLGEQRTNQSS